MKFDVNYFPILTSTNDYIQSLLPNSNLNEGFVVSCGEQGAGRGLGSNAWHSAKDQNLLISTLLRPEFLPAANQFKLSMVVALSIQKTLSEIIENEVFAIKWPNDIYWKKKKIAGILIENSVAGNHIISSIIGIGLNVNQVVFPNYIPNPISMKWIANTDFKLDDVLKILLENMKFFYEMLQTDSVKLNRLYHAKMLFKNQKMEFQSGDSQFLGEILGVNNFGQLMISTDSGTRIFSFKEVEFIF